VAIQEVDVTPVVEFGWNEVPNVDYINGVFNLDGFLYLLLRTPMSKLGGMYNGQI